MGRGWALGLGLAVAALVGGACGMEKEHAKHDAAFSAEHLGDADEDDSFAALLSPEEREAVERSGMTKDPHPDDDEQSPQPNHAATDEQPKGNFERNADTAGKLGVALLSVGVTLGAIAAPFFLF
jgi:hypothetical protein